MKIFIRSLCALAVVFSLSLLLPVSRANSKTNQSATSGLSSLARSWVRSSYFALSNMQDDEFPDLGVTKLANADTVAAGSNVTFTITVTNGGTVAANSATMSDALPAGMTFVSLNSPAGWTCSTPNVGDNGTVECTNPSLPVTTNGDTFTIVAKIPAETPPDTSFNNVATVSTPDFDVNDENNSSTATVTTTGNNADVGVLKSVNSDFVRDGADVAYTIKVTSTGNASDVTLDDTLPGTMTFVSLDSPAGWNCMTPSVGSGGTVSCTKSSLSATSGEVFTLTGNVPGGTPEGTEFTNTATVTTSSQDPNDENNSSTATMSVVGCVPNPVVINNADSGPGSLRQAIQDACPGSIITFDMTQFTSPIVLTSGELPIDKALSIQGPDNVSLAISGNNNSRIFLVYPNTQFVISNLTLSDGQANPGGAIYSVGDLTISNSTFVNNYAIGGEGGAIDSEGGTLRIINSTISGNKADTDGGGLLNCGTSVATLTNVTITNNRADANGDTFGDGGGIGQVSSNKIKLNNTIVAGNFKGTGTTPDDIFVDTPHGSVLDSTSANNLVGVNTGLSGISNGTNGNKIGTAGAPIDPLLGPLANNGGPTQTHMLLLTSPAIDAGNNALAVDQNNAALTTDQRGTGFPRIVNSTVDIGAVEVNYTITPTLGTTPQTTPINTAFGTQLQVVVKESGNPLNGLSVTFTAPSNGASGTFAGNVTTTSVLTNNSGVATAPVFTANGTAGSYVVTAALQGGTPSAAFNLTNAQGQAQVNLSNLSQNYDGTPKSVTVTTVPANLSVSVTYNNSTTPPTNAGSYAVVATVTDPNYQGMANGTLVINMVSSTTTVTVSDATFDGNPHGGTAVVTGAGGLNQSLTVTYTGRNSTTYGPSTTAPTNAGDYTAAASFSGDTNHTGSSDSKNFTIFKAPQTITFNALSDKTYGDADFNVSATASSNLGVSFSASGQCTINGNTVHLTGAGSCTITASQAGNSNYNAATDVQRTFNIAKAATTTTVTSSVNPSEFGQSVTFTATVTGATGAAIPTGTVQFKDNGNNIGAAVGLNGSGVATLTTSTLTAGTHTITADYNGDGNYLTSSGTLAGGQKVNPQPTLSINDVTVTEGNSGTTNATFTVTLSAASNLTVTVNYATADGTATIANNDYQAQSNTLTFMPGDITKSITVLVNGDTITENDENFFVNLSNPTNAAISRAQGTGTILNDDAPVVQFSSANYSVNESGLHATITVNRLGDTSQPASVDYATNDLSGLNPCSQVTGNASQRCDYAISVGTLRFAANESSKTIFIPIVNDVYIEGPEIFTITLSNPAGTALGVIPTATVTINDDDNGTGVNPLTDDAFFIRQLYIDFLDREPEPAGQQGWLNILNHCSVPTDCDRIAVALGFVRSPEFLDRGYFIFRFYVSVLGRNPKYNEFIPDMARLSGFLNSSELEASKAAYVNEFMSRQEFKNLYDPTIGDPTSYVDKLLQTAGLPNHPLRNTWITGLSNNSLTRAQVLRQLIESTEVFTKFYNQAFVVMQYFGFLRRDPDAAYQTWIDIFNHTNDYRIIVNGFINSPEYPLRFGP